MSLSNLVITLVPILIEEEVISDILYMAESLE